MAETRVIETGRYLTTMSESEREALLSLFDWDADVIRAIPGLAPVVKAIREPVMAAPAGCPEPFERGALSRMTWRGSDDKALRCVGGPTGAVRVFIPGKDAQ